MGWQRDMWNYHPSLPVKNVHMIEDIEEMHGNMLLWSCLGSGAIGLPYLYLEAEGEIPPRMRLYGYMNDREFCEECRKRGIRPFAVLWKAQLWEFPAEWNEEESGLLSLNILRHTGGREGWLGMRELSMDQYPRCFPSMKQFFPDGLMDYLGRRVGDFLEEFRAVSLEGRKILSRWLMAPGHSHKCYAACANKQSYLMYLKKETEMMIDAGAGGLHIDEYDSQKHVVNNAGCFCPECVDKFRKYLKDRRIPLPADAGEAEAFDYRSYLLKKGFSDRDLLGSRGSRRREIPLFEEYECMQMDSIEYVVRELAAHAREYAKSRGRADFQISANLFNCYPHSWNCKKYLDVLSGEKTGIGLRQDGWYRFAAGWRNGKQCCFVEDPNAYVREMAEDVKNGINDRMILFLLEPMAQGFCMAFPYGSWLQNQEKDALWPDLRMLKKLGPWLDEHEKAFSCEQAAELAVLYDWRSAVEDQRSGVAVRPKGIPETEPLPEELGAEGAFDGDGEFSCFFQLVQKLCDRHLLFQVIYASPDEPLTEERLMPFRRVVLPDAFAMDGKDQQILQGFRERGGEVFTLGKSPATDRTGFRADLHFEQEQTDALTELLAEGEQEIRAEQEGEYGIAWYDTGGGRALHVVNYSYESTSHRIVPIPCLRFELTKPGQIGRIGCFPENPRLRVTVEGKTLRLENVGIYTLVELVMEEKTEE